MDLKNKKIEIEGERIFLKTLTKKNATDNYCYWLNDPEVNQYLETRETSVLQLKEYIKEKNEAPDCLFLGIFFKENRKHIGNIKIEPVDFKNLKGTIGILIGDKNYWGRGLATEAVKILCSYAFEKLNLKEVNLGVISENKAAIGVYKKAGFQIDRTEKKAIRHGEELFDKIIMSIHK